MKLVALFSHCIITDRKQCAAVLNKRIQFFFHFTVELRLNNHMSKVPTSEVKVRLKNDNEWQRVIEKLLKTKCVFGL